VRGCLPTDIEGVSVADRLREALLDEAAADAAGFDAAQREETLWRLLRLVAVGGGMCQWEDDWGRYLDAVRALYRDLVAVARAPAGGGVEVTSPVFLVEGVAWEGEAAGAHALFPRAHALNTCLVAVDPRQRSATVLHFAFVPYW
jgi:hypothetical protein